MKIKKTANFSIGLWSLAIVLFTFGCSQIEDPDFLDQLEIPERVDFIKGSPYGDMNARVIISEAEVCGESSETCLLAGRTIEVGNVEVYNDEDFVYITASTEGTDWYFFESHLKISETAQGLGTGKNPAPGKFPYKETYDPVLQVVTYEFEIGDIPSTFFWAFHAVVLRIDEETGDVLQSESAWGCGPRFVNKGSWATYSGPFTIQECEEDEIEEIDDECYEGETGWAGASSGAGNAWWYYFDTEGDATQMIYAGQNATDGSIEWDGVNLTIDLGSMILQDVSDPVKVQGYDELPSKRPAAGLFTTYKGEDLTIAGDGSRYYAIHLDLLVPVECPEEQ
ncbi:hypothetical protein [Algoriphagus algorifonticola]|uniref:hypothetical protein n=1 Tax=Algoriphagus algorifonticola TaxID=2593007 RepID=UPI0011A909E0|nr:hypothetical protein [Algoriphagus algorifonticola]